MTEQKTDIVKYRNEFNLTNINVMDKIEMDILFTICSKITKNKSMETELDFDELEEKAFLTTRDYSTSKSLRKLKSLADKITNIKFVIDKKTSFDMMTLFNRFTANEEDKKITVSLNPCFAHYLFDIPEKIGFSKFELEQFIFLKSKYSKTLFRFFLENYTGKWVIDFQKFKEILDFPTSYSNGRILEYTKKLLPELENTGYFSNIEMDYTTRNRQGRPIKDVIFSYKINKEKALESQGQQKLDYELATEEVVKVNHVLTPDEEFKVTGKTEKHTETIVLNCPRCGGSLITKTKKDGGKYHCCTNSRYWKLGSADCDFYEDIEST